MLKTVGITSLAALLALSGCVVQLKSSKDNENGGSGGVGGSSSTAPPDVADDEYEGEQLPPCEPDALSDTEKQAIVDKAIARFEEEQKAQTGTGVDSVRKAWNDEIKFARLMGYMYEEAGCSELREAGTTEGQSQQGLHASNGPDYYCGPGHGPASPTHPKVSQCLNDLCKLHDACYTMCNRSTEDCTWDTNTQPCDDQFLARAAECESDKLSDYFVRFLANSLAAKGKFFSCGDMVCPEFEELGTGICATDAQSADCTQCLAETDVGNRCFEYACGQAQDEPFCYTANCPRVAECYGGYGRGLPGATPPKETVLDPDSRSWIVEVVSAVLPTHKPSGAEWDVAVFGFDPPDPYARVQIGDDLSFTGAIQESVRPEWYDLMGPYSAQKLRDGIGFEFWDQDFVEDDFMGGCVYPVQEDDFNADWVEHSCDTDTRVLMRLIPE